MGLLSKLKSLLGVGDGAPSRSGDVDVTVEREPSEVRAGSERAVTEAAADVRDDGAAGEEADVDAGDAATETGAETAEAGAETAETEAETAETGAETTETEAETAEAGAAEPAADGPAAEPVDAIKGIGPSYAGRLSELGVETVGDLAGRDPEALAEETGLSAKRIDRWVQQAEARTR